MSIPVIRADGAWWVLAGGGTARRIATSAATTAGLLADRQAIRAAATARDETAPLSDLRLASPVTAPCRVIAQMTNYASHVRDSGMDPATVPLTVFRKASGSITGPDDEIIKPPHVKLLDYEVELGLVIGEATEVGATVSGGPLPGQVAALVVANDVSARDVQLPKTQFYESKSYPTFTPTGPVLLVLEPGDAERFGDLRLQLSVNGEPRQDSTTAEMIYTPLHVLQALSRFQRLDPGDLILTGTPGGTALKSPGKALELLGSLLPPALKWKAFFNRQAANPRYLRDGDLIEASIATPDGKLDLGRQHNAVRYAK